LSLCLCLAGSLPVASIAATTPSAEVFGALPHISDATVSPNGNMLAWVQVDSGPPQIVMYDLATQKAKRMLTAGKIAKPRNLLWLDDDTLLMEVSATFDVPDAQRSRWEFWRWVAVDASGGGLRMLLGEDTGFGVVSASHLIGVRPARPKTVFMSRLLFSGTSYKQGTGSRLGSRGDNGWVPTLFEVDTTTGKASVIETGDTYTTGWVVNADGHVLARDEWHADRQEYRIVVPDGSGWRELLKQNDGEQLWLVAPTMDSKAIIVRGRRGESHSKAWSVPLDGSPPTILMEDPERDVMSVNYDWRTLAPESIYLSGGSEPLRWLNKPMEARFTSAARAFPGTTEHSYEESQDHSRALVVVGAPSHAPVNYIVDFSTHKATIIGEEYPALAGVTLGETSRIEYKARDGTTIPAFQTLPPGTSGRNLPLIVLPHGGPHSSDSFTFNWMVQFLATRGYAVLQPQFRGSTGYGHDFEHAGDRQWGGLMQDDVTDGVKTLIESGVADPHRVCIVGGSYGGYAALAGAAFTPDLYACAVSIAGISDLQALMGFESRTHGEDSDTVAAWKAELGPMQALASKSPARAAAAIRAPVLLIHGVDDTVVPISQSEVMDRELKRAGKKSTLVKLPGEDHWLSRSETRIRVLKELEAFLATNLKAQ
jgi:dipeptidyl aminopeptidase/acylaminoacyl peptidase